jgi:hypothetical protein
MIDLGFVRDKEWAELTRKSSCDCLPAAAAKCTTRGGGRGEDSEVVRPPETLNPEPLGPHSDSFGRTPGGCRRSLSSITPLPSLAHTYQSRGHLVHLHIYGHRIVMLT